MEEGDINLDMQIFPHIEYHTPAHLCGLRQIHPTRHSLQVEKYYPILDTEAF